MTATQKKLRKMKDIKLAQVVVDTGANLTQAARRVGLTPQAVQKRFHNPEFQSVMTKALEKAGISDTILAKKIKEGMSATKPVQVGSGEYATYETIDDHPTRHKFIVTALQVKGHIKTTGDVNTQVNVDNSKTQIFADLIPETVEGMNFASRIRAVNDRLSQQFK